MLTAEEIELVQTSWTEVAPISRTAADLFYNRLFELDPSLKSLFPDAMEEQKKKLMQTLAVCVYGLNDLGEILPAIKALGERHLSYRVRDEHYATVGAALLWTLQQGLGESWTPKTARAWAKVYAAVSTTMKLAAARRAERIAVAESPI